jgi:prevent-host-death family protein
MATRPKRPKTKESKRRAAAVGVRELRQNLSRHLRRVEAGETLEVTEHGRPVAILAPLPAGADLLEQLIRAGRVRPPRHDLLALGPPLRVRLEKSLGEALNEEREERRLG